MLDGAPFGQPALSLATQLQRHAQLAGIAVLPTLTALSVTL